MINEIRKSFPENESLYLILISIVVMSFLILLFLVILTVITKLEITYNIGLILNLLTINFIDTVAYICNYSFEYKGKYYMYINSNFLCNLQSILIISGSLSRDFWILIITFVIYQNIVNNKEYTTKNWVVTLIFGCFGYLIPFIIVMVYFFSGVLGVCELNCWIAKSSIEKPIASGYGITVYAIKFICIALVVFLTILIIRDLYKMNNISGLYNEQIKRYAWKMLMFPVVQFITGIIPAIYTLILECVNSSTRSMGFFTLLFGSIQGILFPICYLFNTGVFTVFGCCKTQKNNEENEMRGIIFDKTEEDQF